MVLPGCTGCRVCELMCSFHHLKRFQPRTSSIIINSVAEGYDIRIANDTEGDGRLACNFCVEHNEKICVKYCIELKAKSYLKELLAANEKNISK